MITEELLPVKEAEKLSLSSLGPYAFSYTRIRYDNTRISVSQCSRKAIIFLALAHYGPNGVLWPLLAAYGSVWSPMAP